MITEQEATDNLVEGLMDGMGEFYDRLEKYQEALRAIWKIGCNRLECRANSGKVNHSYCRIHEIIARALEEDVGK